MECIFHTVIILMESIFRRYTMRMKTVYYRYGKQLSLRMLSVWKLFTIGIV